MYISSGAMSTPIEFLIKLSLSLSLSLSRALASRHWHLLHVCLMLVECVLLL